MAMGCDISSDADGDHTINLKNIILAVKVKSENIRMDRISHPTLMTTTSAHHWGIEDVDVAFKPASLDCVCGLKFL